MGRGLSDLQKRILVKALETRRAPPPWATSGKEGPHRRCDLEYREFLGWREKGPSYHRRYRCTATPAERSALSRAVLRLQARRLVEGVVGLCRWSGLNLTPAGIQLAMALARQSTAPTGGQP